MVVHLSDRNWFLLAVVCYGLGALQAVFLGRSGFRRDNHLSYAILLLGGVFHTVAMFKRGFSLDRCPINNLYEATAFIMWTLVATHAVVGWWSRLRFLGAFLAPLLFSVGVFALMPALDVQAARPTFTGGWSSLHKALILLAFGAFGVAAVAGLMYLTQDRNLKMHKLRAALSLLPPIQRLELVITRLLAVGVVLLTLGLVVSGIYLKQTRDAVFTTDVLAWYSVIIWTLYLGILVARWRFAQRGRRLALGVICSFAFLMLTFWGVYLLSDLHRATPVAARTELPAR
ncbi:MAG: hypothetical protein RJA22_1504 [Verrucomicrobiota bacterium]|jgi:ABC-type uncharacterized transport system permease subunit